MSAEVTAQLVAVLVFALAGGAWSVLADVLYCVRLCVRSRVAEAAIDLLWMACGALALFLLVVSAVQESLRGYMAGSFFGAALLWHLTLGKALRKLILMTARTACRIAKVVERPIIAAGRMVRRAASNRN